jgi:LysM repeat protein
LQRTPEDEADPATSVGSLEPGTVPAEPRGLSEDGLPASAAVSPGRRARRVSAAVRRRQVTGALAGATVVAAVAAVTTSAMALWGVVALLGVLTVAYGAVARTLNHRAVRRELASAFGAPAGDLAPMDWGPIDARLQMAEPGAVPMQAEMTFGEIAAFAASYFTALALTPVVMVLRLVSGDIGDLERHNVLGRLVGFQAYWRSQSLKMVTASVAATAAVAVVGAAGSTAFAATAGPSYTVQAGDSLGSIAANNGTTVAALVAANQLADPNVIMVGQVLTLSGSSSAASTVSSSTSASGSYTVQAGDTLGSIAAANGTTVAALEAANSLADPNMIMVGQVLVLSGTASSASTSTAAASTTSSSTSASGSYTVQAGDTLGSIAAANGTTVAALEAANSLADPNMIMVGQVLALSGTAPSASTAAASTTTSSAATPTTSSAATPTNSTSAASGSYTVQAGDTVGSIATMEGTTAQALAAANNLTNPNVIFVGEVLVLSGAPAAAAPAAPAAAAPAAPAATPATDTSATDPTTVSTPAAPAAAAPAAAPAASGAALAVQTALAQVGVPYVWGGESPSGFDCSGLVAYAWAAAGVSLAHYTYTQESETTSISEADLEPGDLVFYGGGEHVAMYIGNGQVVSANTTGTNVQTQSITYDGTPTLFTRVTS